MPVVSPIRLDSTGRRTLGGAVTAPSAARASWLKGAAHAKNALKSEAARQTALTSLFTVRPARGIMNCLMRVLGPINSGVPAFPMAAPAIAPLRAKAEAQGWAITPLCGRARTRADARKCGRAPHTGTIRGPLVICRLLAWDGTSRSRPEAEIRPERLKRSSSTAGAVIRCRRTCDNALSRRLMRAPRRGPIRRRHRMAGGRRQASVGMAPDHRGPTRQPAPLPRDGCGG